MRALSPPPLLVLVVTPLEVKSRVFWPRADLHLAVLDLVAVRLSGGRWLLGTHVVKSWSSAQAVVALSSAEADYYEMQEHLNFVFMLPRSKQMLQCRHP